MFQTYIKIIFFFIKDKIYNSYNIIIHILLKTIYFLIYL